MGAAFLLPRVVGQGRALELLLLGDDVEARTAERMGLANRVVAQGQVMAAAREWAERLAQGPGFALGTTKLMVTNEWNMDLISALESEAQAQALMMMGEDHRAFYEAFREKRTAEFRGR
jgi:enoyl-CoA hydratase/carnithine racemase